MFCHAIFFCPEKDQWLQVAEHYSARGTEHPAASVDLLSPPHTVAVMAVSVPVANASPAHCRRSGGNVGLPYRYPQSASLAILCRQVFRNSEREGLGHGS